MKKRLKGLGCVLVLTMGLTMLSGCGKKVNGVDTEKMIEKYSALCTLGEYKGVEYVETKTEITDEMLQAEIDDFLADYATSEKKTSGTAEEGDNVNIDFVGSVDGVEFEGGSSNGAGYDLVLGSGRMIEGFEEQIIGHKVGDVFDIDVTFPEEYNSNPDLAGADAVFEITINYITITTPPDYTDEFIASNTDAANIEEYENSIRENLQERYKTSDENYNKSAVMTAVIDSSTINEYPEQEMQELIDKTISDVEARASESGYDLATYVAAMYGMSSEEAFREYVSSLAEDYMKEKIVVCAIAKAENISVEKKEADDYKKLMMESYGITDEEEFSEYYSDEDIVYYTLADKVVDFLLENGTPTQATDTDATDTDASEAN